MMVLTHPTNKKFWSDPLMLLHRFYDEDLAQASYFIGCQAQNTAVSLTPVATSPTTSNWPSTTA